MDPWRFCQVPQVSPLCGSQVIPPVLSVLSPGDTGLLQVSLTEDPNEIYEMLEKKPESLEPSRSGSIGK